VDLILVVYQNNKESMKKAEKIIIDLRQKFPEKKILVLNLVNPRTKPNLNLYPGSMYKYDMEYDPLIERYSNNYIFRGTPEMKLHQEFVSPNKVKDVRLQRTSNFLNHPGWFTCHTAYDRAWRWRR